MELPEIKKGVSIKILKDDPSIRGIHPEKDSYFVRGDDESNWAGIRHSDRKFSYGWSLHDSSIQREYDRGNISVQYPRESKDDYEPRVGDVLLRIQGDFRGDIHNIIKIDKVNQTLSLKNITRGHSTTRNWSDLAEAIDDGWFGLVDGPSMQSYTPGVLCHMVPLDNEPKDNGSRTECFWCGEYTVALNFGFGMSNARMCEHCKK